MIGVIQGTKVFEFRDENELARALDWFGDKYGAETVFVVDTSDRIKAIVHRGDFTFAPSINDETKYYLYGNPGNTGADLEKNEPLPSQRDWLMSYIPFAYINQKVPKDLELY